MIDIINKRCLIKGCKIRANYSNLIDTCSIDNKNQINSINIYCKQHSIILKNNKQYTHNTYKDLKKKRNKYSDTTTITTTNENNNNITINNVIIPEKVEIENS